MTSIFTIFTNFLDKKMRIDRACRMMSLVEENIVMLAQKTKYRFSVVVHDDVCTR
jgi:hypothetical protein